MNNIFQPFLRKFVLIFFDDILVYSSNWTDHLQHLKVVFQVLLHHKLYVKYSKCAFGAIQIEYLGHIISQDGVAMDQEKVQCILDWPCPKSVKEVKGFLGLTGYYQRFFKHYGVIARPIATLLKTNSFTWTEKAKTARDQLKEDIDTALVLALPDFTSIFVVESDASSMGIGAMLS